MLAVSFAACMAYPMASVHDFTLLETLAELVLPHDSGQRIETVHCNILKIVPRYLVLFWLCLLLLLLLSCVCILALLVVFLCLAV